MNLPEIVSPQQWRARPEWEQGCPSCSAFVDQLGNLAHLRRVRS